MWMQTNWGLHCSPPQQRLCSGKWFPSCQPVASSYISQQKPSPTTQRRKSAWPGPLTEPMKQHMIKKCCWEKDTFLYIEWEAHRTRAANRHHKQRTTLTKHLENCLQVGKVVSRYDPVKYRSDCPACSTGEGTWIESCSVFISTQQGVNGGNSSCQVCARSWTHLAQRWVWWKWCLLCTLTRQPFRLLQDLRNLAAAQEAISWAHCSKVGSPSSGLTDSAIVLETRQPRRTMPWIGPPQWLIVSSLSGLRFGTREI